MRPDPVAAGRRPVRRAVVALVLTALAAFAVAGGAAVLAARSIAEKTALAEAVRSAQTLGNVIFVPVMPAVMRGDERAVARLDEAILARKGDGGVIRVKVWDRAGTVLYSNEPTATGTSFPLNEDVRKTIDQQASWANLSDLTDAENITEPGLGRRMVEVYVPLDLPSGQRLALETYSSDARVATARAELIGTLVPFVLLASLVLVLAQLPVSVWLLRRVSRADAERGRLLFSALTASERERREIARDLHDSVVQDLAGASYAMSAVRADLPADSTPQVRATLDRVSGVVRGALGSLRTMMVDIYPPDLTEAGLPRAVDQLAERLRGDGVTVTVTVDVQAPLSSEVAAAAYRCARECTMNIAKHAAASHAWIELVGEERRLCIRVADDGRGVPRRFDTREAGHLGLQLVRDAVTELGGSLTVQVRDGGGTDVRIVLPVHG
jgi:two-component system NarL family sensor kinase